MKGARADDARGTLSDASIGKRHTSSRNGGITDILAEHGGAAAATAHSTTLHADIQPGKLSRYQTPGISDTRPALSQGDDRHAVATFIASLIANGPNPVKCCAPDSAHRPFLLTAYERHGALMARQQNTRSSTDEVVERPPWLIPVLVASGVVVFAAIFLWYYVGPTTEEILGTAPESTDRLESVHISIGDVQLAIPANFTRFAAARSGGAMERVDLHALLPEFDPFTERKREEFDRSDAQSPVLHMRIEETNAVLAAQPRLELVYLPAVSNRAGEQGPYNLRHFVFRNETGFNGQDMYVGEGPAGSPAILICSRDEPLLWCRREILLSENVVLRYRYKRAHLADWKSIDNQALALVALFRDNARPATPPEELRLAPAD